MVNNTDFNENDARSIVNSDYSIDNNLDLFKELCTIMMSKFGYDKAREMIIDFFKTSDIRNITHQHNLRSRVNNKEFISFIDSYARKNNSSIEEMVERYCHLQWMFVECENKEELLKNSLIYTYKFHQKLYEEGHDNKPGDKYVKEAILQLIMYNTSRGFTRMEGIRKQIEDNISGEEAYQIILKELGINEQDLPDLIELCDSYLDRIIGIGKSR